jgi:class 3 adenylate cyclase
MSVCVQQEQEQEQLLRAAFAFANALPFPVTLCTLDGNVVQQNAGSIACFGLLDAVAWETLLSSTCSPESVKEALATSREWNGDVRLVNRHVEVQEREGAFGGEAGGRGPSSCKMGTKHQTVMPTRAASTPLPSISKFHLNDIKPCRSLMMPSERMNKFIETTAVRKSSGGNKMELEGEVWYNVSATTFMDPVMRESLMMLVHRNVTKEITEKRTVMDILSAEHALLSSIFPKHILEHTALNDISMQDYSALTTAHTCVTVLFADVIGFTPLCVVLTPAEVMTILNDLFSRFDDMLDFFDVYKIETIGDCYVVAGGLMRQDADGVMCVRSGSGQEIEEDSVQARKVLDFAKAMHREARKVGLPGGPGTPGISDTKEWIRLRIGMHSGPVYSGIVGSRIPRFCLFGDTMNTASRMESTCPAASIHVSAATHALCSGEDWKASGGVEVKGKGIMETYSLSPNTKVGRRPVRKSNSNPGIPA